MPTFAVRLVSVGAVGAAPAARRGLGGGPAVVGTWRGQRRPLDASHRELYPEPRKCAMALQET